MKNPELERYLADLEKALSGISTGERAEIITEIKSHIDEAKEREPERDLSSLLASLGDPKQVANRYLMERGISPSKPPSRAPLVTKWLVIGFLGTIALSLGFSALILWKFSPIVEVNEDESHVRILGGLIDIHDDDDGGLVSISGVGVSSSHSRRAVEGSRKLEGKALDVQFGNGKFTFSTSADGLAHWKCAVKAGDEKIDVVPKDGKSSFDLTWASGAKCQFEVPAKTKLTIEGGNGRVAFEKPRFDVELSLLNGKVSIAPRAGEKYRYHTEVTNGVADNFASTEGPGAFDIKVNVANGRISRQ